MLRDLGWIRAQTKYQELVNGCISSVSVLSNCSLPLGANHFNSIYINREFLFCFVAHTFFPSFNWNSFAICKRSFENNYRIESKRVWNNNNNGNYTSLNWKNRLKLLGLKSSRYLWILFANEIPMWNCSRFFWMRRQNNIWSEGEIRKEIVFILTNEIC